ncbi:MAG: NUDIX hydrolase [Spirochaetales bacterium]|nr:NUDIX hydrolase [Spirochaetales bacterium]
MNNKLEWQLKKERRLHECRIFDLYTYKMEHNKQEADFFILKAPHWVSIIPVLSFETGELLMVRQYRHGIGKITCEFPAGLVEVNEEPFKAAQRELLEETGYRAEEWYLLATNSPAPAFMNNCCYTFLATKLSNTGKVSPDEHEKIESIHINLKTVMEKLGTDEFINSQTMISAMTLERYLEGKKGADRIRTGA